MTPSARLQQKTDLLLPAFCAPGRLLLDHPRSKELYPTYLASGVYVTLAMVPLMETALERSRALAPGDQVAAGLVEYLARHIPEEMHGDGSQDGALADLEAIGVDTGSLRASPPPRPVAAIIGMQYFWILQCHPVAILGLLQLEAYHPRVPAVEQLIERTGLPRDGFRQLLLHAELDVQHAEDLCLVLDSLPLEPPHEALISLSALQTMALLIEAWLDVVTDPSKRPLVVTKS